MTQASTKNGWKTTPLNDFAEIVKDAWKPGDAAQNYIGLEHINAGKLTLNGIGLSADLESNKFKFQSGDILFGKLRPYFRKVVMPSFDGICSTDIWVLRAKENYDQGYLFYFMANPVLIDKSMGASTGSRMPRADWNYLKNTTWEVPLFNEQHAIAKILSCLDDKAHLLQRQNETLERVAQEFFHEWFIEFNFPNAEGKPYRKHSGSMTEGIAGDIPTEWTSKSLFEVADYINGSAFKDSDFCSKKVGLPVVRIAELKQGFSSQTNYTEKELASKYYIQNEDILFSWSGSPETSIDIFIWDKGNAILNQHIFKVVAKDADLKTWVYFLLKHLKPFFIHRAKQKQTTGLGHVTVKDLKQHYIPFPSKETIEKFNSVATPLFQKIVHNLHQMQTLSVIRDSLLPRLMDGTLELQHINSTTYGK